MNLSLVIESNASLNSQDSPCQTYGCRHQNPDNCASNSMENVCAFVTADNICLKPPARWAKQYEKLLMLALNQKSPINDKSRKTPEGINRLLYLVKLLFQS